jgi:hypothetical protein
MTIRNDEELKEAVSQASALLQSIHEYCVEQNHPWSELEAAKVRFPRGFIRPAAYQRHRLPFIKDQNLKSNLAYTLLLSDAILWLGMRTDLAGTAQEMLTKLYIFLIATLCESITKDYLKGICGKNVKSRNEFLAAKGIINENLQRELDWLWDTRNRMHLFQLEEREYETSYNKGSHMRCIFAFRELIGALTKVGRLEANKSVESTA